MKNVETLWWLEEKTIDELERDCGFYFGSWIGAVTTLVMFKRYEKGEISKKEFVDSLESEISDDKKNYNEHNVALAHRKNKRKEGCVMNTAYSDIKYLDEKLVDSVCRMIPDLSVEEGREIVEKDDLEFETVSTDRFPEKFDNDDMFQTICAWVHSEDRDTLEEVIETLKKENRSYLAGMVNVDYEVRFNIGYS